MVWISNLTHAACVVLGGLTRKGYPDLPKHLPSPYSMANDSSVGTPNAALMKRRRTPRDASLDWALLRELSQSLGLGDASLGFSQPGVVRPRGAALVGGYLPENTASTGCHRSSAAVRTDTFTFAKHVRQEFLPHRFASTTEAARNVAPLK